MPKTARVLACALVGMSLLTGCSKPSVEPPAQTSPVQTPSAKGATPKPVAKLSGPVYLLPTVEKSLWPGWVAVSVENSEDARPQSGLTQADLVVEALAEGTMTRFTAYYGSQPAEQIGPVRSARQYTVAQAKAYGSPFAHAGGNMDALATLRNDSSIMNLDEIYSGVGQGFWRSSDRVAPHNLYTSTNKLKQILAVKGYTPHSVPTSPRAEGTIPETGTVERVTVHWSGPNQIEWIWNSEHTAYERFVGTEPHPVTELPKAIFAPNLVFLSVQGSYGGPADGWHLDLSRGGKATAIVAGAAWEGRWELIGGEGFRLVPAEGTTVPPFFPGPIWAHLVTDQSTWNMSIR